MSWSRSMQCGPSTASLHSASIQFRVLPQLKSRNRLPLLHHEVNFVAQGQEGFERRWRKSQLCRDQTCHDYISHNVSEHFKQSDDGIQRLLTTCASPFYDSIPRWLSSSPERTQLRPETNTQRLKWDLLLANIWPESSRTERRKAGCEIQSPIFISCYGQATQYIVEAKYGIPEFQIRTLAKRIKPRKLTNA